MYDGVAMPLHRPPRLVPRIEPHPVDASGMTADEGDERFLDGLRARRPWAEREALARFTPLVRRVLVRILGWAGDVDDLAQEVFLRALDRIGELRDGVAP